MDKMLLLILQVYLTVSVSGMQNVKVSCQNQNICALKESSVNLKCSFSNINIITGFWFSLKDKAKWMNEEHPEDLALDSDYAGRVSDIKLTNFSSTLTITDLRERDSGEYHLMVITDKGERYQSSDGVTLTVTDLHVTQDSTKKALVCSMSCHLTVSRFYWYKNGQYLEKYNNFKETFPLSNTEEGTYSCSVDSYNEIPATPLCLGSACWSVTYTDKRVCVLEGSSVEMSGSYLHPSDQTVIKVFWFIHPSIDYPDLKKERQFINRVEYVNQNRSSTLKMTQVTKKDSGEYRLRLLYTVNKGFSGRPGVILNVTDLQVRISHSAVASEGQTTVTLSCMTSCTLSNNPIYMWYKNGQPVISNLTKHNKLYLNSSEDAGRYSCAVRGREDLRSPEQTVTRDNQSSAELMNVGAWGAAVLISALLLSLLTAVLCIKRKTEADIQSVSTPRDDTYTALNPMTMSQDYDTLKIGQSSASDTYTTLNPATISADYDTLANVQGSASNTYMNIKPANTSYGVAKLKK